MASCVSSRFFALLYLVNRALYLVETFFGGDNKEKRNKKILITGELKTVCICIMVVPDLRTIPFWDNNELARTDSVASQCWHGTDIRTDNETTGRTNENIMLLLLATLRA